jgi:Spy/CpxP family protein refolding chaperone
MYEHCVQQYWLLPTVLAAAAAATASTTAVTVATSSTGPVAVARQHHWMPFRISIQPLSW